MQYLYEVFKVLIFIVVPIFINSCSSSSYYERYRDFDLSNPDTDEKYEDEILYQPTNVSVNEKEFIINKLSRVTNSSKKKEKFLSEIISYLNTPYRYGGNSRSGIDCSAFTQTVYRNSLDVSLPRTAREQYRKWKTFDDRDKLKFGDLVYFNTSRIYYPGHVGIYLDDDLFAHASSSKGVIVSSLANDYYSNKFIGANRVTIKQ
jgi:cell wall-associated NlpC family hydrolase